MLVNIYFQRSLLLLLTRGNLKGPAHFSAFAVSFDSISVLRAPPASAGPQNLPTCHISPSSAFPVRTAVPITLNSQSAVDIQHIKPSAGKQVAIAVKARISYFVSRIAYSCLAISIVFAALYNGPGIVEKGHGTVPRSRDFPGSSGLNTLVVQVIITVLAVSGKNVTYPIIFLQLFHFQEHSWASLMCLKIRVLKSNYQPIFGNSPYHSIKIAHGSNNENPKGPLWAFADFEPSCFWMLLHHLVKALWILTHLG